MVGVNGLPGRPVHIFETATGTSQALPDSQNLYYRPNCGIVTKNDGSKDFIVYGSSGHSYVAKTPLDNLTQRTRLSSSYVLARHHHAAYVQLDDTIVQLGGKYVLGGENKHTP